jgi:CheY-like chemotaxis protein
LSKDASLSQETRLSINTMKRNGEHLADLIEGVLEVSKIEAGRLYVHRDEVQLRPFLEQLVNMFRLQAVSKGLDFTYHFPVYLPDYVTVDKQRLRQILINLISNAIKFTQQGSVFFSLTYRNEVAHFSIKDTGEGVSDKDQEVIFKPFERVLKSQNKTAGTGLGLTISRALAELMGGDISVKSEIGKGSIFNLSLLLPKIEHIQNEGIAQSSIKGYEGPAKRILVVDDEQAQRDLIRDIMYPVGFIVEVAESAFSAMLALNQKHIDLILLDLKMPNVNGWQAAKKIRGAGFNQPIVIVSANVRDLEVSNTAIGHHNDYLVKPFMVNALLEKVGHWLSLTWVQEIDEPAAIETATHLPAKMITGKNQYNALKVLAEIGYLSGFTSKLNKINEEYTFPKGAYQSLRDFAQQCQFQKITQTLDDLTEATKGKPE